jgi:hypothetical protein
LGTPILGDIKYGDNKVGKQWASFVGQTPPLHLHAWHVRFRHPMTGKVVSVTAPPPVHFMNTLRGLDLQLPSADSALIDADLEESHFGNASGSAAAASSATRVGATRKRYSDRQRHNSAPTSPKKPLKLKSKKHY